MEAVHFKLFNYKYREPTSVHWLFISHFTEQTFWQANKLSANQKNSPGFMKPEGSCQHNLSGASEFTIYH